MLHRVAAGNELAEVKAMIALGANPNLTEHHYRATPIGFAIHNRAWDVAHYLKDFADNIFDVCCMLHVPRVELLLQQDPKRVCLRTTMGHTPLHVVGMPLADKPDVAAATQIIALLLRHGADPEARNNQGMTPREWHRRQGNDAVADLLRARM